VEVLLGIGVLLWIVGWILFFTFYERGLFFRLWREPVFLRPVCIIESDDWGPGPEEQARVLLRIKELLAGVSDSGGHPAVMTLGVILASPDTERMAETQFSKYFSLPLTGGNYDPIRREMMEGYRRDVFALQLHGKEHYWPDNLLRSLQHDAGVRDWLMSEKSLLTVDLPAFLQSRWADALDASLERQGAQDIDLAVREEIDEFERNFGFRPVVAVPPTFVWNDIVENSWWEAGIRFIVTPGRRFRGRSSDGKLQLDSHRNRILNGERSTSGAVYVVRDDYFEPALGHTSETAQYAIEEKSAQGRPTLFETHRFNFLGDEEKVDNSIAALESLLANASEAFPDIRFIDTATLARAMEQPDPAWIELRARKRMRFFLRRLLREPGLGRFLKISGFWVLIAGVSMVLTKCQTGSVRSP
jgi:hypothetical protein